MREDYSAEGDVWRSFPHDQARSRAYRWGEDGLLGIADHQCRLAFSLAVWNGRDPILKERLFGLANPEGNHGEDVKELYDFLDATPTASYLAALYRYPQAAFPHADLVTGNARRGYADPEYELLGTGLWDEKGGFYYDHLHCDGRMVPLKCRSMVGLVPLFAVETFDRRALERLPAFRRRVEWFARNRPQQTAHLDLPAAGTHDRYLLSAVSRTRLRRGPPDRLVGPGRQPARRVNATQT